MHLELQVGYFAHSLISGLNDGAATLITEWWMNSPSSSFCYSIDLSDHAPTKLQGTSILFAFSQSQCSMHVNLSTSGHF